MKFAAKDLERNAKKCEKSEREEKVKLKKVGYNMCCDVRKPVLGVSDEVSFKLACSATETSLKIEIPLIVSLDMIISNKQITEALIRKHRCAGCSAPLLF